MSKRNGFMRFLSLLIMLVGLSVLLAACSSSRNGSDLPPATYSISGTVSGEIRQSVNIAVSGAMSASVSTDANGNYSVSGLPNGSYTVTPSKAGYAFTLASRSVVIGGAASSGNDFTAAAVLYTVSGTVSGAVTAGVTITVAGTTEAGSVFTTSIATAGGSYSVPNIPNGSYTVTPAGTGYSFAPVSIAVTVTAGNASIAAFTSSVDNSVKFNLTGTVSGAIKTGVTINVTGTASGSASTLADGTFTVANLPNGAYTVSASKSGYTFSTDLATTVDGADSTGNNFTATAALYSISGTVSGDVKSGVTITIAGTTEGGAAFGPMVTTTSGDGSYSAAGVQNGVYTVGAVKSGYSFNPVSYAVTIIAGNSANRDFTASMNPVTFTASGGTGTNGTGGNGGQFYAESYGSIKVLKSGTVDASFTVPPITPGANPFIVSSGTTTVPVDDDPASVIVGLYAKSGDPYLYSGDGDGDTTNDSAITDLTIAEGATLALVDQTGSGYGSLQLDNNLLVNGTLTSDLSSNSGLEVEAKHIEVGSTGMITASATAPGNSGGEIYLGYGQRLTATIINRGTIEARGDGSGYGGFIYFEPDDLVVNYGTIDVNGGSDGGSGGGFEAYVDYGDFYSSGTVRMSGGNGTNGGDTEYYSYNWNGQGYSCWIETAYVDNTRGSNGKIIISGIWEAKGGDGSSGNGGVGGYMYFQTDAMGTVTVNASMSVKGGTGAGSWGGYVNDGIDFYSVLDPNGNGGYNNPTPGKISIAGTYDLRGGDGDSDGGSGGRLKVQSQGVNSSNFGSDVEFVGFPVIFMNGGQGGTSGGSASGTALELYTYASSANAKEITNEADVHARGGAATQAGGTGGTGGFAEIMTGTPGDVNTVLSNSGNIDVSGGGGENGSGAYNAGAGDAIHLDAQHVNNSGSLTANGGNGTTGTGGNGGNITVTSEDAGTPTTNTGTLGVTGGAGTPAGGDGTATVI